MLGQRVLTAVVLAVAVIAALAVPSPLPFLLLAALAIAAGGWEWARLNGLRGRVPAVLFGLVVVLTCVTVASISEVVQPPAVLWWSALAGWIIGGGVVLRRGVVRWGRLAMTIRAAVGLAALVVAWLALAHARTIGVNFLLSILCVVWAADIAAYFGGRAFGRRKLAPSISPGKSWAGVWSGMAGVLALAALWLWLDARWNVDSASLFTVLHRDLGVAGMAIALIVLAAMSVVGDLFESLVKRAAGAKDSSRLLPGHGGVLDRIDALLPVLPAAMAVSGA